MAVQSKPEIFSLIPRRKLLALHAALLRCRAIRASGGSPRNDSESDAAIAAVALCLKRGDAIAAGGSELLPALIQAAAPPAQTKALAASSMLGRGSTVAALKAAFVAARARAGNTSQRRRCNVVAVFAAGRSASPAAWRNALCLAAAKRLPILFVGPSGAHRRRPRLSGDRGTPAVPAFPIIPVDGDDAVALYRVVSEALAQARRGNGPTLIECVRWPFASDGRQTKRQKKPAGDAIANLELYLAGRQISFKRSKPEDSIAKHPRS